MEIKLITVGKTDVQWVREGLELYASRLKHYIPFSVVEIPELKKVSALTQAQIKEKEGELILKLTGPQTSMATNSARWNLPTTCRNSSPAGPRAWYL